MWVDISREIIDEIVAYLRQTGRQGVATLLQRNAEIEDTSADVISKYREAARRLYHWGGRLEVDGNAAVSLGDDAGAYVMCWRWITDEEAGVAEDSTAEARDQAP